jgi:hypothetical protein
MVEWTDDLDLKMCGMNLCTNSCHTMKFAAAVCWANAPRDRGERRTDQANYVHAEHFSVACRHLRHHAGTLTVFDRTYRTCTGSRRLPVLPTVLIAAAYY